MKKILVTGAQGFIGKNLVNSLKEKYIVQAPTLQELDLRDGDAVGQFLAKNQFDVIIHAANWGARDNAQDAYQVISYGLQMFHNIENCREYYGKLIYFGSGAEYDRKHWIPQMKEEYFGKYIPEDAYGLYKYVLAKFVDNISNVYDLRLFGVCGIYEQTYRFLSSNICRALKGMPLTLSQNAYYDYISVDDLANIVYWFIENTPCYSHYNICRGEVIDLYTLASMIRDMVCPGREILVKTDGWKTEYSGDNKRLLDEIGNYEFVSYQNMIQQLVRYYEPIIDQVKADELP